MKGFINNRFPLLLGTRIILRQSDQSNRTEFIQITNSSVFKSPSEQDPSNYAKCDRFPRIQQLLYLEVMKLSRSLVVTLQI